MTIKPDTVHTASVFEVTVTGRPESDVAVTRTDTEASGCVVIGANVIVWSANVIKKVVFTLSAAL